MPSRKNMLTMSQKYELINWLKRSATEIREKSLAQSDVAKLATENLGFLVSPGNISGEASEIAGVKWTSQGQAYTKGHIKVIVEALFSIYEQLDATMPDDFRVICERSGLKAKNFS